jgi:hypothetical protein
MRFFLSPATLLLTFFFLPGLFFLSGCKNDRLCCGPVIPNGLTGSWLLYQVRGNPPGRATTVPSDSAILSLQSNGGYESFANGQVVDSGTYIIMDTITNSTIDTTAIQFGTSAPVALRLNNDSLFLGLAIGDSVQRVYLKIY